MGSWYYKGKYAVQFTVDSITKDSWEDFKMIPEKKPVMQAPDLGLKLFRRFEFSTSYVIEDNENVDSITDDIIDFLHGKTGTITIGENTYSAIFNISNISPEDNYTTFTLQAILRDFDGAHADNSLDFGDYNTWEDWHLIPDESFIITPPPLKEKYIDIPGRNGAIDLTNAVMGQPRFERMTGEFTFTIFDNDPVAIYNDILENLHGHKFDEVEILGKKYDGRWVIKEFQPDGEEPKITLGYNLIFHAWTWDEANDGADYYAYIESVKYDAEKSAAVVAQEEVTETELASTTDIVSQVEVTDGYDGAYFVVRNTNSVDVPVMYVGAQSQITVPYAGESFSGDEKYTYYTYVGETDETIEEATGTAHTVLSYTKAYGEKAIFVPAVPGKNVRLRKLKTSPSLTVVGTSRAIKKDDFIVNSNSLLWSCGGRDFVKSNDCPALFMSCNWEQGSCSTILVAIRHEGIYFTYPYDTLTPENIGSASKYTYSINYNGTRYFWYNLAGGTYNHGIPTSDGNSLRHFFWGAITLTEAQKAPRVYEFLEFCDSIGAIKKLKELTDQWVRANS